MASFHFSSTDVPVVNRFYVVLMLLLSLNGSALAADPTPAQRSTRPNQPQVGHQSSAKASTPATKAPPTPRHRGQVIGAGVRSTSQPAPLSETKNSVRSASATSGNRVVKASHSVIGEGIVYEETPRETVSEGYVVDEGSTLDGSCSSCGEGGCDGGCDSACGSSCGTNSGWGPCGFDLCSPGPGRRRQLCICLPSHGWAQMDYLMWWHDGMRIPALLTTSTTGTTQANAGVLGLNSTSILLGNEDIIEDRFNGGRIRFGWWFANCPSLGIEGEYFGFKTQRFHRLDQSTGNPILARPFFNVAPESGFAREDSELIAFPNVVSGSFTTNAYSTIDGAAVRFRKMVCCGTSCSCSPLCCTPVQTQSRIDMTLGWRFLQLREELSMREDLQSLRTFEPGSFLVQDNFRTRNQFNGVECGFMKTTRRGYWTLEKLMRVSLGTTRQEVVIDGSTTTTQSGTTSNFSGGLLAQRTNSGTFTRDQFAVVTELGLTLGYQLTPHWQARAGYSFIHWSDVVRPGDQIDTDLNPNLLPPEADPFQGALRPRFSFKETDYWLQGVNLGAEYRW